MILVNVLNLSSGVRKFKTKLNFNPFIYKLIMIKLCISISIIIMVYSCKSQLFKGRFVQSTNILCDTCSMQTLLDSSLSVYNHLQIFTIKNDSVINFSKRYFGLGWSTDLRYRIFDNVMIFDTIDIYGTNIEALNLKKLKYNKDSLIDLNSGSIYYLEKNKN
jgi:hypothetical protein